MDRFCSVSHDHMKKGNELTNKIKLLPWSVHHHMFVDVTNHAHLTKEVL